MADIAEPKEKANIFSLPIEIRNTIWHHALEPNNKQCTRKHKARPCRWCVNRCPSYTEPVLLQVSRKVRAEAQSVWYSNTTFYFHDGANKLLEFLVFLGNHKTSKITNMKDEPGFGKACFAREFLDDIYRKIKVLGIQLSLTAIEVTTHEGLRLLRSSQTKDMKVAMRKNSKGENITSTPVWVAESHMPGSSEIVDHQEEDVTSDSTLSNSDAESELTYLSSDEIETLD